MAGALLTVVLYRTGHDLVAAGFLVFAIGESMILSGAAMDLDASVPSFGAGSGLWAMALALIQRSACLSLYRPDFGTDRSNHVRRDIVPDFRGCSAHAHFVPIAFFRLSVLRGHILRVDLDAFEG
jgi:hypothetical protein